MCMDTPTGYNCTCFTGYQLAPDMINCTGTMYAWILRPSHLFSALLFCLHELVSNMPCSNIRFSVSIAIETQFFGFLHSVTFNVLNAKRGYM